MIQNNRKHIVWMAAAAIVVFLGIGVVNWTIEAQMEFGQGTDTDRAVYQYHIAMIGSKPYDEFWTSVYEGASAAGEACGAYIENFGEDLDASYTVEELLDMAIAAKVDGIIVEAAEGDKIKDLIDRAAKEDIPVMTVLSDVPNSSRVSFVSGNSYALGELYGSQVAEEVKRRKREGLKEGAEEGKVKVAVLVSVGSEHSQQSVIYSGIREMTAAFSRQMELSAVSIRREGRFESEETVRDLILGEERPDLLVCLSAADTISAYQCVVDYNMVGKISIIGYYASEDILEEIKKGVVKSTVSINAKEMGKTAAEGMYKYLTQSYVSEYLPVASELITSENVSAYKEGGSL